MRIANPALSSAPEVPRVVFIDDDVNLLTSTRRLLRCYQSSGWRLDFFSDPAAAVDSIVQEPTDLVVTDMQMPVLDGAQLIQQVTAAGSFPICFILTGQAGDEALGRSLGAAQRIVRKPCPVSELRALCAAMSAAHALVPRREDRSAILRALSTFTRVGLPLEFINALKDHDVATINSMAAASSHIRLFALYVSSFLGHPADADHIMTDLVSSLGESTLQQVLGIAENLQSGTSQDFNDQTRNSDLAHVLGESMLSHIPQSSAALSLSSATVGTFLLSLWNTAA